ncbi:MAG: AAA domain-containing protein [Rhizomicrobium sp.]
MGLKFRYLPDARYDRGNSRTNQIEARAVAEAVIRHARETPDQSLGVAAFSVAQRGAILKELELLRRADSGLEPFFRANAAEPFFVKNLENIQGDERDVIFISVGYGKNENGYMAMNFGPLSSDGGERRLNVLISRAKLRCEIFSSITADDIDLERGRARGVAAFKLFLRFAQTGKFDLGDAAGRGHDSIFEEQVAGRLKSLGHDVRSQIGTAGFFVDLAISDPDKPGRYVLGIECDGAQYHASRSARDRDRLRQLVLEDHGWIIHRIWSADWYLRPTKS